MDKSKQEGSLGAPTRHSIEWETDEFYDQSALDAELERVFDVCHGCRRCVNLCESFPTLFDLIDESDTLEVDGVAKKDYQKVVDQCYLCDMCFMTKCPYVPPHEWNIDFPHLMLRAKAVNFKKNHTSFRDKTLTNTNTVGKLASIPVVNVLVNKLNETKSFRKVLAAGFGVHQDAKLPTYHHKTLRKRLKNHIVSPGVFEFKAKKIALFATCYGNYNSPELGEDFLRVFEHNDIQLKLVPQETCCGMPKLELGDLDTVKKFKDTNIPVLSKLIDQGFDLIAPIPSCVLMFKQELPLMFPNDTEVQKVKAAFYDPFEYLFLHHKEGKLKTDFKQGLGNVSYQVACHLRVQNIGLKTRDILSLIPETQVHAQERCSGHDGTYAVRKETHEKSVKIGRAVARKVDQLNPDVFASDCPMAATHIASISKSIDKAEHPMTLLRMAYGL